MDGYHDPAARLRQQTARLDAVEGRFDPWLLGAFLALSALGLVMVASSSIAVAEVRSLAPLHYFYRHALYLALGLALAWVVMQKVDARKLEQYGRWLPFVGLVLLLLVLVPGLGQTVKGARRWIGLGPVNFQPAEAVKLIMIVWLASYLARFSEEVEGSWTALLKAFGMAIFFSLLLLVIHKDFGTTALLLAITAGMLLLGGAHLPRMIAPVLVVVPFLVAFILIEPYRVQRLTSFRDPWQDPFGDGYQLSNALMAIGRGEFWGVGLGGSVQKLNYLPESYTDFILAVIGEELGFVGICLVVGLYAVLVGRALWLGLRCAQMRRYFSAYLCFGIAIWMAAQTFISIGVNLGMLPTKGLTLPLISFGGSSILISCIALGLLLRVSWEYERARRQVAMREVWQARVGVPEVAPASSLPQADKTSVPEAAGTGLGERLAGGLARLQQAFAKRERAAGPARRERIDPSFGEVTR